MNQANNYNPQVVHVNAQEGYPSTFWVSKTGKYYRTKNEAIKDDGVSNVNPDDYAIKVSFLVKYKNYILGAAIAALVTALLIYYAPKIIAKVKK